MVTRRWGLHAWVRWRPCPSHVSGGLGGVSGVLSGEGGRGAYHGPGGQAVSGAPGDMAVDGCTCGPGATPHVGVMGRISRALSEVGVSVLTMELEGWTASDTLVTWRSMQVHGGFAGLEVVWLSFVVVCHCAGPWGCRGSSGEAVGTRSLLARRWCVGDWLKPLRTAPEPL